MLSLHAISDAAISALPLSFDNYGSVAFECSAIFEGIPYSSYLAFVTNPTVKFCYTVEIGVRLRTNI